MTCAGGIGEEGTATASIIASGSLTADIVMDANLYTPISVAGDITGDITTGRNCEADISATGEITGKIEIGTGGSGGDLVASISGGDGIASIRVHGDIVHPTGAPAIVESRYGVVGELIVDGKVALDGNRDDHDFELRCEGIGRRWSCGTMGRSLIPSRATNTSR